MRRRSSHRRVTLTKPNHTSLSLAPLVARTHTSMRVQVSPRVEHAVLLLEETGCGSPTVRAYSPWSLPPSEQRSALQRVGFVAVQQQLPLQPVDLGTERGTCNMQYATLSLGRSNFRAAVATVRPGRPARRRATEATHRVGTCAPGRSVRECGSVGARGQKGCSQPLGLFLLGEYHLGRSHKQTNKPRAPLPTASTITFRLRC
jgi:hypothetical protein